MYDEDRKDIPVQDGYRSTEAREENAITTNFTMRDPDEVTGNSAAGTGREAGYASSGQTGASSQTGFSGQAGASSQTGASGQPDSYGWERQYNRMNMGHIPPEPAQHPKKKKGMASRVAGTQRRRCCSAQWQAGRCLA